MKSSPSPFASASTHFKAMKMESSSSSWLENLSPNQRMAIEELVKGQDLALQLKKNLIQSRGPVSQSEVIMNEDLVANILNSFTNSLSILKNGESDEVSQVPGHTQLSSPCWDGHRKSEDSGESCKSSRIKDRRGCYKRRKCADTRTTHAYALIDDGLAWRKYGQKVILNAKYPRNYFRCSHKHDQGCQATKQVQRIEDDPPLYRTTYYGHHTCKNLLAASQLIVDSTASGDQCPMISFVTNITDNSYNPIFSSFPPVKQESKDDNDDDDDHHHQVPSDHMTHNNQSISSSDHHHQYLLSPDHHQLPTFESTGHMEVLLTPDHGDVISGVNSSCTTSAHSMDIVVESVDHFDDILQIDF